MKYIDAEKLIAALERQNADKKVIEPLIRIIDSLQQEPLIHTELCTLIACDVIQATAKRAIEKPQDKDKEEDLMIKKMEYLNMLEKRFFQQEQPSSSDLDEAAEEFGKRQGLELKPFAKKYFKDGAKWQYQKDRGEFAKLKAKEWMSGYDDAVSRFVKIPYEPRDWFSIGDGDFICGVSFDEAIPAGAELYYRRRIKE